MTKALIPKQGGNLANRALKAGWGPHLRAALWLPMAVPWPSRLPLGVAPTSSGAALPPLARWLCRLCRKCNGQGVASLPGRLSPEQDQGYL